MTTLIIAAVLAVLFFIKSKRSMWTFGHSTASHICIAWIIIFIFRLVIYLFGIDWLRFMFNNL